MPRIWFWSACLLLAFPAGSALAQPSSPLDLVRGLREQGMPDLALEYLKEIEAKPLAPDERALLPLERAKCLLEAGDAESDEAARAALLAEAREALQAFRTASPNHPRAIEASLALARSASLEAKATLARARRIDSAERRKAEASKARPLFAAAATAYESVGKELDAKLRKGGLDARTTRSLELEKVQADLNRGINLYTAAETYINPTAAERRERAEKWLEAARRAFNGMVQEYQDGSVAWLARAWRGECYLEMDRLKEGDDDFARVLAASGPDGEAGRRMVLYFQCQRAIRGANTTAQLQAAAKLARAWLAKYDTPRRPTPESLATKWALGANLLAQAVDAAKNLKPDPATKLLPLPGESRIQLAEAERIFRALAQSDNEFSTRAVKSRLQAIRLLQGDAEKRPQDCPTFDDAQVAALIEIAKLTDAERDANPDDPATAKALQERRLAVVALLERCRELATEKDNPADVSDVLIRLVYFYQISDQPFRAAVLGEHLARTARGPGAKPAAAGAMALNGYTLATTTAKAEAGIDELRKADRERAVRLALYLDEKFPNDPAADRARHRLGALFYEDGELVKAFDALLKVRPGYEQVAGVRIFQAAIASQLLAPADSPLPDDRKREVFRRTAADLDRIARPLATADLDDVRGYLGARCRLAVLYLLQSRVDPEAEKAAPGYAAALKVAEEVLALVPTYSGLSEGPNKLNPDGLEMKFLAEDARTRALYLIARGQFDQGKFDDLFAGVGKLLAEMNQTGPYLSPAIKKWEGGGEDSDPVKARVARLADGADRVRRDVIVLALKARVKQGQIESAAGLLDLLKKFGGGTEANLATLQQVSAEIASQIMTLRKEGKTNPAKLDEAKALTDGFANLLNKVSAEPNLPPAVQLFVGQSLVIVGEPGKAVEVLRKLPKLENPALLAQPADKLSPEQRQQVAIFRVGTLHLARAHRMAKQYAEADAILKDAMGTADKPGWGYNSLDYRKEVAALFEARGAEEPDPKAANGLWGQALKEWTVLYSVARKRYSDADPTKVQGAQLLELKSAFFEAFLDVKRCHVAANTQLQKTNPTALQKTFDDVAKQFVDLEKANAGDLTPAVRAKYADLLEEMPDLKKAYEAAGGKLFLQRDGGGM